MLHHLELLLGAIGAVETAERKLVGVAEEVVPESSWPAEASLALGADVGSLVAVLLLVCLE